MKNIVLARVDDRLIHGEVVSVCRCKQAIENKPGAPLKCLRPGNCPGQVKNNMQFKKDGCEYIIIGNCSDCSNTVMASAPQMGLKVFHQFKGIYCHNFKQNSDTGLELIKIIRTFAYYSDRKNQSF